MVKVTGDLINSDSRLYKSLDQPRDGSEPVGNQLDRSQLMQVQGNCPIRCSTRVGVDAEYRCTFLAICHKRYILSDLPNRLGLVTRQQRWS